MGMAMVVPILENCFFFLCWNMNSQLNLLVFFFEWIAGDQSKDNNMSAHIGLPALDISAAFPQATPASVFPPLGKIFEIVDAYFSSKVVILIMKFGIKSETHPVFSHFMWEMKRLSCWKCSTKKSHYVEGQFLGIFFLFKDKTVSQNKCYP